MKAIEIKSSSTFSSEFLKGVGYFKAIAGDATEQYVVYAGSEQYSLKDIQVIPFTDVYGLCEVGTS